MMTTLSMRIPDFFQPRQQEGQAGAGARFDLNPPFRVFGESSAGAAGQEEDSDED
ncbi:hypothetical protein Hanom_Chr03g00181251 [Helianthus anomalus]